MKDSFGKTDGTWTLANVTNKVFQTKFENCITTLRDWVSPVLKIPGSTILDFGCGDGVMALGTSLQLNPKRVIGVELRPEYDGLGEMAKEQIGLQQLPSNLEFHTINAGEKLAERFRADCIFSWSVFEHVSQDCLDAVVTDLANCLNPGGIIFVQIAPLYYSAQGAHLFGLVDEPWAHLIHQENLLRDMVMKAKRSPISGQLLGDYDEAGFRKYREAAWDCYRTLNKITGDDLIELFRQHEFELIKEHRTNCQPEPSATLKRIFNEKVLRNEQIVVLFRKTN